MNFRCTVIFHPTHSESTKESCRDILKKNGAFKKGGYWLVRKGCFKYSFLVLQCKMLSTLCLSLSLFSCVDVQTWSEQPFRLSISSQIFVTMLKFRPWRVNQKYKVKRKHLIKCHGKWGLVPLWQLNFRSLLKVSPCSQLVNMQKRALNLVVPEMLISRQYLSCQPVTQLLTSVKSF